MKHLWLPRTLVTFAAVCGLLMVAEGNDQTSEGVSLAKMVREAFDKPRATLAQPVLVFPAVDANRRLAADGAFWSNVVTLSLVYGPERRMAISAPYVFQVLGESNLIREGTPLTDDIVRQCAAATDQPCYVIPTMRTADGKHELELAFHGNGREVSDKTFRRTFTDEEHPLSVEWSIETILEHVGHPLSGDERELLSRPQFASPAAYRELFELTTQSLGSPEGEVRIKAYLARHPHCVFAWERFLSFASDGDAALTLFEQAQPASLCRRLSILAATRQRELGRPREAIMTLLPSAPTHFNCTYFNATLLKCLFAIEDRELIKFVLGQWRAACPGYADSCDRGSLLIEWAWKARGDAFARQVEPENMRMFAGRLEAAKRELEHALEVNPDGWAAHTRFLTLATGLGLDRETVEEHFAAATRLRPAHPAPFRAKFNYLEPKWHGSPEELIEFGKQCLATDRWEEGIASLFLDAVDHAFRMPQQQSVPVEPFRSPELWASIKEYHAKVNAHGTTAQRRRGTNYFALWGALGGHYADVQPAFEKLRKERVPVDLQIFPDELTFLRLADEVRGATPSDWYSRVIGIRAALWRNQLDEADQRIAAVKPDDTFDSQSVQHYRRVLALARVLQQERKVVLKGQHWRYAAERYLGHQFLERNVSGDVQGDSFAWTIKEKTHSDTLGLVFPLTFDKAQIQGRVRWTPGVRFVQIGWQLASGGSPSYLRYYVENKKLVYIADNWTRHEDTLDTDAISVRITCGDEVDRVEINDRLSWEVFHTDHRPGALAISALIDRDAPGTLTIDPFEISLVD